MGNYYTEGVAGGAAATSTIENISSATGAAPMSVGISLSGGTTTITSSSISTAGTVGVAVTWGGFSQSSGVSAGGAFLLYRDNTTSTTLLSTVSVTWNTAFSQVNFYNDKVPNGTHTYRFSASVPSGITPNCNGLVSAVAISPAP